VDAAAAMHADGFEFFVSDNEVWLCSAVPPSYLSIDV
jgi:putative RNA 2'-phosphotransferase